MPTAGRLAAAVAFAAIGAYIAMLFGPLFQEGKEPSWWWPLCIGAGVWSGWVVVGKRAGRGYSSGIGNGLTGIAAHAFWIVFALSFADMIRRALRRSFDGPVEAIVGVFEIMGEYGQQFADVRAIGIVIICGAAGGLFTEFFAKRFP